MNIFEYLIDLGILFLIYDIIFKVILLLFFSKLDNKLIVYIIATLKYFFLVSLSAAITIGAINKKYYQDNSLIVFSIVGGLVLFLTISGSMYKNYKSALSKQYYLSARMHNIDIYFLIGSILLYILILNNQSMVDNELIINFFKFILYIQSFTIIRILLNIWGSLFMIYMLVYGVVMVGASILFIIGKIKILLIR